MPGGIVGEGGGHLFTGADGKAGVAHAQRPEQPALQRACQRHAVQRLDHQAQHVGAVAIAEGRPRGIDQRQRRQPGQQAGAVQPGTAGCQGRGCPGAAQRGVRNLLRVGKAGGVAHQVAHRGAGHGQAAIGQAQAAQRGQDLAHRRIQVEPAFIGQHQRGHRHHRLGQRRDAKAHAGMQGRRLVGVDAAERVARQHLAGTFHQQQGTGAMARRQLVLQQVEHGGGHGGHRHRLIWGRRVGSVRRCGTVSRVG